MSKRFARYTVAVASILAFGMLVSATPAQATPPQGDPVFSKASVTTSTPDRTAREWAVSRPTRGANPATAYVRRAATPPPSIRGFAECVLARESGASFDRPNSGAGATNGEGSGAAGRWQFMPNWRNGLPYMIKDRLEQFGMPHRDAKKVRIYLSKLHYIHKYPGVYQDIGFLEVMERGGKFHWNPTVPGTGC